VLNDWLTDEGITLACGRWDDGAIMEIVPKGKARLMPEAYADRFSGVRELRVQGAAHHLHIDFARLHSIEYTLAPSVCFGFRPALEVRILALGPGGARTGRVTLTIAMSKPYVGDKIHEPTARRYFERLVRHVGERPDLVSLVVGPKLRSDPESDHVLRLLGSAMGRDLRSWDHALAALPHEKAPPSEGRPHSVPVAACKELLGDAIDLKEASLVIFRDRTLVEFKTEGLGGVFEYREGEHTSWQIGRFEEHHCHLALDSVTDVEFSAEPVSCQGGRINYTVWFLVTGGCGNPFRSNGYFSVTLNRPYDGDRPRIEVIEPVFELYRKYQHLPWVKADQGFTDAMGEMATLYGQQRGAAPRRRTWRIGCEDRPRRAVPVAGEMLSN